MRSLLRLLSLLLAFAAAAYASEPVHVGVSMSLTGKYAELGAMSEKAYRLWERDVNLRGGILGRPVKLKIVDDQSEPATAKQIYLDLVSKQKVDLVLGPYSSAITEAV